MFRHALMIAISTALLPGLAQSAEVTEASKKAIKRCTVCHSLVAEQGKKPGPSLKDVYNRRAGSLKGYAYSSGMRRVGDQGFTWTEENLDAYILNPGKVIRSGRKSLPGIRNAQMRRDIISVLKRSVKP